MLLLGHGEVLHYRVPGFASRRAEHQQEANDERREAENSPINQDHIDIFTKKWKEFDPKGQGYIGCNDFKNDLKSDNKSQLHEFITSLPEPLGIEEKCISTFNDK
jgi:Ca2+-binding EF-hand superfamily protein